jgi:dihydroorotase
VHFARLSSASRSRSSPTRSAAALPVTCDVAIYNLHLSDRDIGDFDANCHLVPPLRDPSDRDQLRRGLAEGVIDAVCSDHTPVDEDMKQVPFGEAEAARAASSSSFLSRSSGGRRWD